MLLARCGRLGDDPDSGEGVGLRELGDQIAERRGCERQGRGLDCVYESLSLVERQPDRFVVGLERQVVGDERPLDSGDELRIDERLGQRHRDDAAARRDSPDREHGALASAAP